MNVLRITLLSFAIAILLAIPATADDTILAGADLWRTLDNGQTFVDLAADPIPRGFFCERSQPFVGKIRFHGVPIATEPPGVLGNTDTIMERIDDTTFDEQGIARTRVRIRALSMQSNNPIETACGRFDVLVGLAGEPDVPVGPNMTIIRQTPDSGYFLTEMPIHFKLTFVPTKGESTPLELTRTLTLRGGPQPDHLWTTHPGRGGIEANGFVMVDTDNDQHPDSYLPGTSNFAVGWGRSSDPTGRYITNGALTAESGGSHAVAAPVHVKP